MNDLFGLEKFFTWIGVTLANLLCSYGLMHFEILLIDHPPTLCKVNHHPSLNRKVNGIHPSILFIASLALVDRNTEVTLPPIYSDEPFEDRKSIFQAHLSPVHSKAEVQLVLEKLKENKKIVNATHNMYAYR